MAIFNFGNENNDKDSSWHNDGYIVGTYFTCPDNGTIDEIKAYLTKVIGAKVKCAIYKHSDGSKLGVTEEHTFTDANEEWVTFAIEGSVSVEKDEVYWLFFWSNSSSVNFWYASSVPTISDAMNKSYNSWPDTFSGLGASGREYDIYAVCSTIPLPVSLAAEINPNAFTGYHCFQEQFQKRRGDGKIPYKTPDGTLYRSAPSG